MIQYWPMSSKVDNSVMPISEYNTIRHKAVVHARRMRKFKQDSTSKLECRKMIYDTALSQLMSLEEVKREGRMGEGEILHHLSRIRW